MAGITNSGEVGPSTNAPTRRLSLSDCIKGSDDLPLRVVHYGRAGFGKTSIAAFSDKPFFLLSPGETGLRTLIRAGLLPNDIPNLEVPDWENWMAIIEDLRMKPHGAHTLVMDTLNGAEGLANDYTKRHDYNGPNGDKEFQAYMAGYRTVAMSVWKEMLTALDALRRERKMMILMLAHTGTAKVANPSGGDFTKWAPAFTGHWAWDLTYGWADVVLFGEFDMTVTKAKPTDPKGKAVSAGKRIIHTGWSPDYDAKGGRVGLPIEIECPETAKATWEVIVAGLNHKETT